MCIEAGVQFLFAKAPICKGFPIPFNDIRLRGVPETVAAEPFAFSPITLFNERSRGVQILVGGVHFRQKGCAHFNYSSKAQKKGRKTCSPKIRTTLRPCILFSDLDLCAVLENEGNRTVPVDDCLLDHHRPDGVAPLTQHHRLFFEGADVKCHCLVLLTLRSTQVL